jgi:tetratricopeptide (TPR) repeat protein
MNGVDASDRFYWQSRAAFYMGLGLRQRQRDREALPFFEEGLEAARKSVALGPTAEGWRMQAECLGHLCERKGKLFLLTNGLKVMDYARRALALDEGNIAARRLIVARTVHAPAIYGGDGPQGVREMRALMDRPEMRSHQMEKDTIFNIYYDMAFALRRAGKSSESLVWLAKALGLYPANPAARALQAAIKENP